MPLPNALIYRVLTHVREYCYVALLSIAYSSTNQRQPVVYRSPSKTFLHSNVHTFLISSISTLLLLNLSIYFQLAERFFHWASRYEKWQVDELIVIPVAVAISFGLFYWRRARVLSSEIVHRTSLEERLAFQANHDSLTNLPNRNFFLERLDLLLKHPPGHREDLVVLFLDLDGFKMINDSSGHEAGDQMLLAVARRLQQSTDGQALLARLGGDEFAILIEHVTSISEVLQLIHTIQAALREPMMVDDYEVVVTTSIGVAFASDTNWTASELLRNADAAMYAAKCHGKSCYEFYDNEMSVNARTYLSLESELRQGVRQQQFRVYYQPIYHLLSKRVVGLEALVRWQHPEKGLLTPDHFLGVAETSGLMADIGDFVFLEACRQVSQWQLTLAYQQTLYLSINLSPRQFQHPAFMTQATEIIRQTAFPAEQLHLEIIETMAMQNTDLAATVMRQLQTLGASVALDDFGTGYSSLAYLRRFPLNGLKIDRSFVIELERRAENLTIVRAIIALTQALGLAVTAEGIETASQLSTLSALGCTYGQGYYFARPMPAEEMGLFLERQSLCGAHDLPAKQVVAL